MGGRNGPPTAARRARNGGRGLRICQASGFVRPAQDVVADVRQGLVSRDFADITPGFGTYHPQDRRMPPSKADPKPIAQPSTEQNPAAFGPADLGFTDAEVREAVRRGVPLRRD